MVVISLSESVNQTVACRHKNRVEKEGEKSKGMERVVDGEDPDQSCHPLVRLKNDVLLVHTGEEV